MLVTKQLMVAVHFNKILWKSMATVNWKKLTQAWNNLSENLNYRFVFF